MAIKSVSAFPEFRPEIFKMVDWTSERIKALGGTVELADVGSQTLHDGRTVKLPDVILATLGNVSGLILITFIFKFMESNIRIIEKSLSVIILSSLLPVKDNSIKVMKSYFNKF